MPIFFPSPARAASVRQSFLNGVAFVVTPLCHELRRFAGEQCRRKQLLDISVYM